MEKGKKGVRLSHGCDARIKVLSCKSDIVRFKTGSTRNTYKINIQSLNNKLTRAWHINRNNWRIFNSDKVTAIAIRLVEDQQCQRTK